jgi:hypothetical protein
MLLHLVLPGSNSGECGCTTCRSDLVHTPIRGNIFQLSMSVQRKRRLLGRRLIHDTQEVAGKNYNKNKGTNCSVDNLFKIGLGGAILASILHWMVFIAVSILASYLSQFASIFCRMACSCPPTFPRRLPDFQVLPRLYVTWAPNH